MGRVTDHRYAPGLDGIRAIAVLAITAYHLRFIDGGILSVSVFFTLSGYLITSVLLAGFAKTGTVDLKEFWIRRARRLLPALMLLLTVVIVATAIARPGQLAETTSQVIPACFYFANWATIGRGDNYFNRFTGPAPFDHLWSLAIEEQFYLAWPLVFLGMLLVSGRKRGPLAAVAAILAAASTFLMAFRYLPNAINNTRAYEGTDTRAAPILIGAFTALLLPLGEVRDGSRRSRVVLDLLGVVAVAIVVLVVARTHEDSPFLYRGGEAMVSMATAALVLVATHRATLVGRLLGVAPLRWLGVRSYGIYLWHMPIVAFMPAAMFTGHPLLRGAVQLGLIIALSALSFSLLEDPVRRYGARKWAGALVLVPLAVAALVPWPLLTPAAASDLETLMNEAKEPPAPAASVIPAEARTSCARLVHVGDSTSLALTSKRYLPAPEDRLEARYRAVGVEDFVAEISGGRAIVEKITDQQVSAYEVVSAKSETYKGCWVFALGNGDAATTRGNIPGLGKRIDWMMKVASGRPVLWTTTKTLLNKGPYQNAYMESWKEALVQACARYPNMRVYDWASEADDSWYLEDHIHPNAEGAKQRAARLASALAVAFPHDGAPSGSCLVGSTP